MMNIGSKGKTCQEFVELMRERGYKYEPDLGRFMTKRGAEAGKQCKNGYRTLMLQENGIQYTFCEHRCVWTWFNGDIPDGFEINHIDADRANNRIENLEMVTHSENIQHMIRMGHSNYPRGEKSGKAIYSDKEVQAMRYLRKNNWTIKQIASLFGNKNENVIGRLINGKRYGHITKEAGVLEVYQIIVKKAMERGAVI